MSAVNDIDVVDRGGTELARYSTSAGERVLMGWRSAAGIEVTDVSVQSGSRGYVVDRGFGGFDQLRAFVADYLEQASRYDACPMSVLGLVVEQSDSEAVAGLLHAA
jgi:hypothetical protein